MDTCYMDRQLSRIDDDFPKKQLYKSFVMDILRRSHPDLIQTSNPFFAELLAILGADVIYHAHNIPYEGFRVELLQGKWSQAHQEMLGKSRKILCVSNFVRDAWSPYINDLSRMKVIYNGVDTEKFRPEEKENIILCSGRIVPDKGQIFLLRAFSELKTDWKLLLTGKPTECQQGTSRYAKECLKYERKNIKFIGFVPKEELIKLYSRAKIFVCPSIWPEPLGFVNIEAMSSGCAVIASKVGGIPEIIDHGKDGFLVLKRDSNAIKETLLALMDDENMRINIARQAREKMVARFEWNVLKKEYIAFYLSLAKTDP